MIRAKSPPSEATDEIFTLLLTINQTIIATKASNGRKYIITPRAVATPFPPSNFKYGLKQCPMTAKTPIVQAV